MQQFEHDKEGCLEWNLNAMEEEVAPWKLII